MSNVIDMLNHFENQSKKLNEQLSKKLSNPDFDDYIDKDEIFNCLGKENGLLEFLEQFIRSTLKDEERIVSELKSFDLIKRKLIAKIMECVVKISQIREDHDIENSTYWWEKTKSLC